MTRMNISRHFSTRLNLINARAFLTCFRDAIRVTRIENWVPRIKKNYEEKYLWNFVGNFSAPYQRWPRIRGAGVHSGRILRFSFGPGYGPESKICDNPDPASRFRGEISVKFGI